MFNTYEKTGLGVGTFIMGFIELGKSKKEF